MEHPDEDGAVVELITVVTVVTVKGFTGKKHKEKNLQKIVCKFGGTSVADEKQIQKIEKIIRSDSRRRFIVPSAPGKRFGYDTKITDLLYFCYDKANNGGDISKPFNIIRQRYTDMAISLCPELDIASQGDTIEQARSNLIEAVGLFFETASPTEIQSRLHNEVYVTPIEVSFG